MDRPIIGVLTWRNGFRFREPKYFQRLCSEARKLGVTLFFFSPGDVDSSRRIIKGAVYTPARKWELRRFPWPDVVIDRYWYTPKPEFQEYVTFREQPLFRYANSRMANKWIVHEVLWANPEMRKWLPETHLYQPARLRQMLKKYSLLYVKPVSGTGGRGILRISKNPHGGYLCRGRNEQRVKRSFRVSSVPSLQRIITRWMKGKKYLIQQGLEIDLLPDRAVDIRLLIQKTEQQEWSVTGMGVRVGQPGSATSNLHGGGKAVQAQVFLEGIFKKTQTAEILEKCQKLAFETARTIEKHFGTMVELGLDIGVDRTGKVWLIEVNPKPGRDIFREMGDLSTFREALQRPIRFARSLVTASADNNVAILGGS